MPFCKIHIFFCFKRMKTAQTMKITGFLEVIPLNNADKCFNGKSCDPSPFGITKRTTCFSGFDLCFKT